VDFALFVYRNVAPLVLWDVSVLNFVKNYPEDLTESRNESVTANFGLFVFGSGLSGLGSPSLSGLSDYKSDLH